MEEKLAVLNVNVLSEAKRIFRLCLHKNLKICPDAQHERAFCIFCAIATKHPSVWEVLVNRVTERKMALLRIPQAGEYNMNDVRKFVRVASMTLGLLVQQDDPPKTSAADKKRPRSSNDVDVTITSTEASLFLHGSKFDSSTTSAKPAQHKAAKSKAGGAPAAAIKKKNSPLSGDDEVVSEEDEGLFQTSVNTFLVQMRDWNEITKEVTALHGDLPSLIKNNNIARLLGLACPLSLAARVDDVCSMCGHAIGQPAPSSYDREYGAGAPSKHQVPRPLQCIQCKNLFHTICVFPRTIEFLEPFKCTECRVNHHVHYV